MKPWVFDGFSTFFPQKIACKKHRFFLGIIRQCINLYKQQMGHNNMKKLFSILALSFLVFCSNKAQERKIKAVKLGLSMFGVESSEYPSVNCFLDFEQDSGSCLASYDDPRKKNYQYHLTKQDIRTVSALLEKTDLSLLKKEYEIKMTDQRHRL